MNTGEDIHGMRKMLDMTRWASVMLLILHCYATCYGAFRYWGWTMPLSDRILESIGKTGLFQQRNLTKGLVLGVLFISLLGVRSGQNEKSTFRKGAIWIVAGAVLFFGSYGCFYLRSELVSIACLYMVITFAGYLLVLRGGMQLSRVISRSIRKEFFTANKGGFQQEERFLETTFSLHLPARYQWQGKTRESIVNFINPRRGILIMGSPGAGKSWFIIEPMICQLIKKGFTLFVYDFKYPALTGLTYNQFMRNRDKYPASARFCCINCTDLSRSHRCNLIDPATMLFISDAIGVSRTILLSMNKTWVHEQGKFFVESPINFLAALIWYLRKYKDGIYCTLPHAIELAQTPTDHLFTLLNTETEIETLIDPFIDAYKNKSMELLDSQLASAKIPLGRLASPDLYYILTGDDLSLDINNPAAPKILCLGGDPPRQEALAPVLSLYIDRLNNLVNQAGKIPCALVCDEFATVRATSVVLSTIPTARSNNIITVLSVQDLSQLRMQYSREEADLILNITGNLVCGQVGGETARWVSERFPTTVQYRKSVSVNSSDTSISRSEQEVNTMSAATIATLSSGEFVGIVADDPDLEMEHKAFHARIIKETISLKNKRWYELPVVRMVDKAIIGQNFQRVKKEIEDLVTGETQRIIGDPALARKVVKR
jgi:hypothetical protein